MVENPVGNEQKAKLLAGIRGFDISRFELRGITQELPIIEIQISNFRLILNLAKKAPDVETTAVGMQQGITVEVGDKNSLIYSKGANPCNIAIAFSAEGTTSVMHSNGRWWTKKAKDIIAGATSGIVGGGGATLQLHETLYNDGSLQVFRPPVRAAGFNIALSMSNLALDQSHNLPAGLYFAYDSSLADEWDPLIEFAEAEIRRDHNLPLQ